MKQVTFGFSTPKGLKPLAWLIRKIERTPYSHAFIEFNTSRGLKLTYEASGSRVRFMGGNNFNEINNIVKSYNVRIEQSEYDRLIDFCIINCGAPYGVKQLLSMGLTRCLKLFGIKIKPLATNGFVCTEIMGKAIEAMHGSKSGYDWDLAGLKEAHDLVLSLKGVTDDSKK